MQTHRFAIGELVAYTEQRFPGLVWRGNYEIVSLLPVRNDEAEYQIRSADLAYDRVVRECELSKAPPPISEENQERQARPTM